MKVTLTNYSNNENPILTLYKAYRLCYSKCTQEDIKYPLLANNEPDFEKISEFIVDKMKKGHTSPLEHISFTFEISDVSRVLTHQLVRHRTGKFSQQSQRYVKNNKGYVVPPKIQEIKYADKIYYEALEDVYKTYDNLVELLLEKSIEECGDTIPYSKLEKQAIEDARYILPNASFTNITVTMDLNNFRKFYALRNCKHAQWEIRELAYRMGELVKDVIPFALEGAMNCGITCFDCIGGK